MSLQRQMPFCDGSEELPRLIFPLIRWKARFAAHTLRCHEVFKYWPAYGETALMKVSTILDQIDMGSIALPEFQRGYVWNRRQVRSFMTSLYKRHPVGSLLVWETRTEQADARGDQELHAGTVKLLLDGQQRITTLYGIIRGEPPEFFDGKANAFTGLHFHLESETFEFYTKMRMQNNPLWIDVTELMQEGVGKFVDRLYENPELRDQRQTYINRLNAVSEINKIDFHVEEVTGDGKTIDVVVDIFNKINSGGTKLSKGDLALAKICGAWPEARDELKKRLRKWRTAGFTSFNLDWLLRCVTTVVTGEAFYHELVKVDTQTFREGLQQTERAVDQLLNMIGSRLGLDFDRVLGSRYSFPLMARYLVQRDMQLDHQERDKLLYWYIHTFLWGRYAGSTESKLNQDLRLIEDPSGALDRLIQQLRQQRGDLRLHPNGFVGWSRGARFYPMVYMLTRVGKACDWGSGIELSNHLLGKQSNLHLHHIFPKHLLYDHNYDKTEVNALANMTFLTQETNLKISDQPPHAYFPEIADKHPGVLESHWIPMDFELWGQENYPEFLSARQKLLAEAANALLDNLLAGTVPEPEVAYASLDGAPAVPGRIVDSKEEEQLFAANDWIWEQGLPEGELLYEIVDEDDGTPIAILDMAWPNGLQEGLTQPVALLLDEDKRTMNAAQRADFRYFTSVEALKQYATHEILALEEKAPA